VQARTSVPRRKARGRWAGSLLLGLLCLGIQSAAACASPDRNPLGPTGQATQPAPGGSIREFDLSAVPAVIQLGPGVKVHAWTYNGTIPGPQIRVTVGDLVRVRLTDRLPEGTTIDWQGLKVPNGEDGVAGVTQDPVLPGQTDTYAFVASTPGTYWYHSFTRALEQVDRGLYGPLIIDPAKEVAPPVVDQTLVYDEWPWGLELPSPPPLTDPLMESYVTYSVNGRTGAAITPVRVQPGQRVRLRLINAGFETHFVQIDGTPVIITAFDGHSVVGGPPTGSSLPLGSGERLDVEFLAPDIPVWVRLVHGLPPADQVSVPLVPVGSPVPAGPPTPPASASEGYLDIFSYPARAVESVWPTGAVPTRSFTLTLTQALSSRSSEPMPPGMESMAGSLFEINGNIFPATQNLVVSQGDLVEITFDNRSRTEHAMHLHGHFFQLLTVDGRPASGLIVKDTVVVLPDSRVTVGLIADNPGWWLLHCDELDHAAAGLMTLFVYQGVTRPSRLGGGFGSLPV